MATDLITLEGLEFLDIDPDQVRYTFRNDTGEEKERYMEGRFLFHTRNTRRLMFQIRTQMKNLLSPTVLMSPEVLPSSP